MKKYKEVKRVGDNGLDTNWRDKVSVGPPYTEYLQTLWTSLQSFKSVGRTFGLH